MAPALLISTCSGCSVAANEAASCRTDANEETSQICRAGVTGVASHTAVKQRDVVR